MAVRRMQRVIAACFVRTKAPTVDGVRDIPGLSLTGKFASLKYKPDRLSDRGRNRLINPVKVLKVDDQELEEFLVSGLPLRTDSGHGCFDGYALIDGETVPSGNKARAESTIH